MKNRHAIINGALVLEDEAKISISDLAIQRGYGVFDYFRTVNSEPVFLDDHLDRLYHSADKINLNIDLHRAVLKDMLQRLIEKNNLPDAGIKITLTGGYSEDGYTVAKPNLLITQTPYTFNKEDFSKGTRLVTFNHQRQMPEVKTIDYLQAICLQPFIKENYADDVLYYDQAEIRECPRANFFIVTNNDEVFTPSKNVLKGITRKKILAFAELNVKEAVINLQTLQNVKEAFITSTSKHVLPVLNIDGTNIGNGRPGEITTKIYNRLLAAKGIAG